MDTEFVEHPLIEPESIERRLYQENILAGVKERNSMVVLPTGLGKTPVAVMLAAHRLNKKGGRVIMLAPTRPLVEQHKRAFADMLQTAEGDMAVYTGKVRPDKRERGYGDYTLIFATPQVIQNDLISGRLELDDYTLLVLDECHRGTGDYPYKFITEMYDRQSNDPLILGLTASPGSSKEKIELLCNSLHLENVEIRTEDDEDVRPYVHKTDTRWIEVDLPTEFVEVQVLLKEALKKRQEKLKKWDFLKGKYMSKRDLLGLQNSLRKKANGPDPDPRVFQAISVTAEALKIEHAVSLLETQGSNALLNYMKRMKEAAEKGKTKAVKRVMNDPRVEAALLKTYQLVGEDADHPKLKKLREILEEKLAAKEDTKVIVFSHYRDSVSRIMDVIRGMDNCRPVAFVGQSGKSGLSQKRQVNILEQFGEQKYNTLVCTSVGEEGLDVPEVDAVVFYEPVASEIRSIQRRGRTGRHKAGEVIVLMAKDTRDEGIYWASKHRERTMKKAMKNLQEHGVQKDLHENWYTD